MTTSSYYSDKSKCLLGMTEILNTSNAETTPPPSPTTTEELRSGKCNKLPIDSNFFNRIANCLFLLFSIALRKPQCSPPETSKNQSVAERQWSSPENIQTNNKEKKIVHVKVKPSSTELKLDFNPMPGASTQSASSLSSFPKNSNINQKDTVQATATPKTELNSAGKFTKLLIISLRVI